jgi:6-phosphofructokinase
MLKIFSGMNAAVRAVVRMGIYLGCKEDKTR